MGVHGLWKLLEPSGKPVTLESLDNKVLAIDVSMWLHQVMKGYQDSTGNALPNAHLLGLFHRICKLMYYRIKPVFVFDGGVPQLKQQTLASRRSMRGQATKKAERERLKLLKNLMEQGAVREALAGSKRPLVTKVSKKPSPFADFILEPMPKPEFEESESEEEVVNESKEAINWDTFDPDDQAFKKLPPQARVEILTDLKEARKQNSWGRIHEMPQESHDFSGYQLRRLLVRRSAQVGLEEAEKELGERHTLTMAQLEDMMQERGSLSAALNEMESDRGHRIASDTTTRFLLLNKQSASQTTVISEESDKLTEDEVIKEIQAESSEVQSTQTKTKEVETIDLESIEFEDEKEDFELMNIKSQIETETELSQSEILALIKTSTESKTKARTKIIDPNMPSTSSAGNYEPVDIEPEEEEEEAEGNKSPTRDLSRINFSNSILQSPLTKIYVREKEMLQAIANVLGTKKKTLSPSKNKDDAKKELTFENKPEVKQIPDASLSKDLMAALAHLKVPIEIPQFENGNLIKSSDSEMKPVQNKQRIEEKVDKLAEVPVLSPKSVSSSDDSFEEVPCEDEGKAKVVSKTPALQILINAEMPNNKFVPEEDIFADIFVDSNAKEMEEKPIEDKIEEISDSEEGSEKEEVAPTKAILNQNTVITKAAPEVILVPETKTIEDRETPILTTKPTEIAPQITNEELLIMEESLAQEQANLAGEVGKQERLAVSISDQMCMEAQELLSLFGLPYVIAPMEAEAQCAILDLLSLTQGTVTDDSDIWLFGGKTVYRNFFNQSRNVEVYTADTIQKCFKLNREQLVLLALLVGSDYTVGLTGIGPVTALEILAAFSSDQTNKKIGAVEQPEDLVAPLKSFREWWAETQAVHNARLRKLKNKLKDLTIHEGFPSTAVVEAYIHPEVDDSREKFSWGKPDLPALIYFAREKFGWTKQHAESILQPVVKRLNDTSVQQRLDSFFSVIPQVSNAAEKMSARVREAVNQLGTTPEDETEDEKNTEISKKRTAPNTVDIPPANKKVKPVRTSEGKQSISTLQAMRKALTKKPPKPRKINIPVPPPTETSTPGVVIKKPTVPVQEKIPQRERDKESALQNRMKAIELFRKRKLDLTPSNKKTKQLIKDDHYLSESSSDD